MALLLCIVAISAGCAPDRGKRYFCGDERFSISFPSEWKVSENVKGTRLLAEIPDEQGKSSIRQNMNIIVEEVRFPAGLKEYMDLQVNALRKLKRTRIYDRGQAVMGNLQGMWFTYSNTVNDFGYTAVVYVFSREKKFYTVTGISQYNNFGKYERTFHEAAKSFRFE
jgi:hypothetical protein